MMNVPHICDYEGKRIHMIGIGGSSMSGLAEMLLEKGYVVTGSDRSDGYLLGALRQKGIECMVGQRAENVHGADLVVYTAAIAGVLAVGILITSSAFRAWSVWKGHRK